MAASEVAPETDGQEGWIEFARSWSFGLGFPRLDLPSLNLPSLGLPSSVDSGLRPDVAVLLVAQAYVAWVLGGIGYFARAGVSWAGYGAVLAQQLAAIALEPRAETTGMRTLLDESAAQLRELGDISVQEARALQRRLQQLAEQLRELDNGTLEEPRRYAKTKR